MTTGDHADDAVEMAGDPPNLADRDIQQIKTLVAAAVGKARQLDALLQRLNGLLEPDDEP
jgi:hypothetical protein